MYRDIPATAALDLMLSIENLSGPPSPSAADIMPA
jgi:hypothetical protein